MLAIQAARVSLSDLFKGGSGRAMFIALMLMVYQQFSGINVVIFYSGKVWS
jgi:SP family facilitated glucose transporter-like MFS transporter 8